jgi:hypothetical protein
MHQRRIVGTSTVGSISRLQARRAAKTVKLAKSITKTTAKTAGSRNGQLVSASVFERYLGHFGPTPAKRSTAKPAVKQLSPK